MSASASLDPVDYAIISQSLIAAAREMGVKLIRSAYSTILREAKDGSAAILDVAGRTVAQAELIPMQLGTLGHIFASCAAMFPPETLEEGDFLLINDPYSGGQHLQDVFIFHPVFHEGTLIGFVASIAHHLDLGGGSAGLNTSATDVYSEGLIFPPLKLNMERDWNGGGFHRFLRANVRVPHQTMGDFDAQMAANNVGILRLRELADRYGTDKVVATMTALQDYSETRMRAAITAVPDGVYSAEDWLDDDGMGGPRLTIRSTVTVKGDAIAIDFAGSSDQVRSSLNSPFASTVSAAVSTIKAALTSPDIPFNAGAMKPITVTAPLGSLMNPRHPAPVRSRMQACSRAWDATMKALAQAVPEKAITCGFDTTTAFCLSKLQPEGWSVYLEVFGGGFGAAHDKDGCDAVDNPLSNCSNTPVEAMDQDFPFFRVVEYALVPDSCGRGARRGGLGFVRSYEILEEGARLAFYTDRFVLAAEGLNGGLPGGRGSCTILRGGERLPQLSRGTWDLLPGDIVVVEMGGGGGYGPPAERDPASIAHDVAEGLVSPALAAAWAAP